MRPVTPTTRNRVAVLHGVNFDVLEQRDSALYGGRSLAELEQADLYEVSDYRRVEVALKSGLQAWVYVKA